MDHGRTPNKSVRGAFLNSNGHFLADGNRHAGSLVNQGYQLLLQNTCSPRIIGVEQDKFCKESHTADYFNHSCFYHSTNDPETMNNTDHKVRG